MAPPLVVRCSCVDPPCVEDVLVLRVDGDYGAPLVEAGGRHVLRELGPRVSGVRRREDPGSARPHLGSQEVRAVRAVSPDGELDPSRGRPARELVRSVQPLEARRRTHVLPTGGGAIHPVVLNADVDTVGVVVGHHHVGHLTVEQGRLSTVGQPGLSAVQRFVEAGLSGDVDDVLVVRIHHDGGESRAGDCGLEAPAVAAVPASVHPDPRPRRVPGVCVLSRDCVQDPRIGRGERHTSNRERRLLLHEGSPIGAAGPRPPDATPGCTHDDVVSIVGIHVQLRDPPDSTEVLPRERADRDPFRALPTAPVTELEDRGLEDEVVPNSEVAEKGAQTLVTDVPATTESVDRIGGGTHPHLLEEPRVVDHLEVRCAEDHLTDAIDHSRNVPDRDLLQPLAHQGLVSDPAPMEAQALEGRRDPAIPGERPDLIPAGARDLADHEPAILPKAGGLDHHRIAIVVHPEQRCSGEVECRRPFRVDGNRHHRAFALEPAHVDDR